MFGLVNPTARQCCIIYFIIIFFILAGGFPFPPPLFVMWGRCVFARMFHPKLFVQRGTDVVGVRQSARACGRLQFDIKGDGSRRAHVVARSEPGCQTRRQSICYRRGKNIVWGGRRSWRGGGRGCGVCVGGWGVGVFRASKKVSR